MKVTIMQPAYLPWLGFFDRIEASDIFVVLDNVQLDTSSKTRFTNRNKIRTRDGWIWLTLPMMNASRRTHDPKNERRLPHKVPRLARLKYIKFFLLPSRHRSCGMRCAWLQDRSTIPFRYGQSRVDSTLSQQYVGLFDNA